MIRFLQRLKSRRGLTLIEVLIATVIFSLILLAAFTMYQPVSDMANMVRGDSDMQRIVTAVEGFIVSQIRNSAEISIIWSDFDLDGNSTMNWTNVAAQMDDFEADKRDIGDQPQALVIRESGGRLFVYNIRLREVFGANPGDAALRGLNRAAMAGILANASNEIERFRVFSRSFYSDVDLSLDVALSPSNPFAQVRGDTTFQMQIDASREGVLSLDSRSLTDTGLTWIGNLNTPSTTYLSTFLRGRVSPVLSDADPVSTFMVATGEIVILYHNNAHFNRVHTP
jgi:prepilin-type N-terminal cleavage/methylation domain-containing protein